MQKIYKLNNYGVILFFLAILGSRGIMANLIGIRVEQDSNGYRILENGFEFASLDSIFGHELRPFPINFIYGILGTDTMRILFQVSLSALSWTILAVEIRRQLRFSSLNKYLWIFLSILVFSPSLIYRDLVILPESITLSVALLAVSIALKLKHFQFKSKKYLLAFSFLLTFLVVQRPTASILLMSTLILVILGKLITGSKSIGSSNVKFYVLIFAISILGLVSNLQNNQVGWPSNFSTEYPVHKDAFVPGLQMWNDHPFYKEWRQYYTKNGLPECATDFASYSGPYEYSVGTFGGCAEANTWLQNEFWKSQLKISYQNPYLVFASSAYFGSLSFVPQPDIFILNTIGTMDFIAFPTFNLFHLDRFEGMNFLIAWNSFLLASIFLTLLLILRKRDGFSLKNFSLLYLCGLGGLSLNLLLMGLIMPSDSYRHSIPVNYLIFILLFLGLMPSKPVYKNE
jgi:hypothetical protein